MNRRREIGVRPSGTCYQVFAKVDGKFRQVPGGLPLDSTPGERAAARYQLIAQWSTTPAVPNSLAEKVERHLAKPEIKAMRSYRQHAHHLELWLEALGRDRLANSVTRDAVEAVLQDWLRTLSPVTVYHRRTSLRSFYVKLNGEEGYNPVKGTTRPDHYRPVDKSIPFATIQQILAAMPTDRVIRPGIRRPSFAKLRATVIAHTGIPPAELVKLRARDFDRHAAIVRMPWRDKGAGTPAHTRELSPEGVAAFVALDAAGAWGDFPEEVLARCFKRAARRVCGPATPISLYWLRHSLGTDAYRVRGDLATVARLLGHVPGSVVTQRYAMGAHAEVDRAALAAVSAARAASIAVPISPSRDEQKLQLKVARLRKRGKQRALVAVS